MLRELSALALFLGIPAVAHGNTLHVPAQYPTIQEAIDAAQANDVVLVAPGAYYETIRFHGWPPGSAPYDIEIRSSGGKEVTIIDANGASMPVVTFQAVTRATILEGFTLTNANHGLWGGGVLVTDQSSPVIENNIIVDNTDSYGAGVFASSGCYPLISNNVIKHNYAHITHAAAGGGIRCWSAVITGNVVAYNTVHSTSWGGGICCYPESGMPSPIITNNTIVGNIAGGTAGLRVETGNTTTAITNNIIWFNRLTSGGVSTISFQDPSTVSFDYNCIEYPGGDPYGIGTGNIDLDPVLSNLTNEDFHLLAASPCRDTGSNAAPEMTPTDIDGEPRPYERCPDRRPVVDMGADEFDGYPADKE